MPQWAMFSSCFQETCRSCSIVTEEFLASARHVAGDNYLLLWCLFD